MFNPARMMSFNYLKSRWNKKPDSSPRVVSDSAPLPLYDIYEDTFEVVRATTPELKEAAHRLRYQVYCMETGFENPAEFPDGLEKDAYDPRSVHTLLIHRKSGMLVGNVRLVLPDIKNPFQSFPMQQMFSHKRMDNPEHLQRSCEVSRFCVSKNFRKREEDKDNLYTGVFLHNHMSPLSLFKKHDQRRVIPFTPLGLMRAIYEMMIEHDIVWAYGVLEPTLIRLLKKLGIEFNILGPAVSFHGERYPLEMDPLGIWRSVKKKHPEIWKVLTKNGTLVEKMEALIARYEHKEKNASMRREMK